MDDVDRMYRHLVRTIRATSPQLLTQPFQVGDLYTTILPYRLHRRELGVETNQDYEMAMLELLSGGRGYLAVDDRMREELGAALRSPNPDASVIRNFSSARVALAPDMLEKLEERVPGASGVDAASAAPIREPDTAPFRASAAATSTAQSTPATSASGASGGSSAASTVASSASAPRASGASASAPSASPGARRAVRPITVSPTGEQCSHCRGELPAGREIVFCPHCGQDLTVLHCPACGSALEHGWKFCVTCGRTTAGT
jgi:hypothetical protein